MQQPFCRPRVAAALAALPVVNAITPEGMLQANRYSDAQPNPSGDFALFTQTNYSWTTHKTSSSWQRIDLKTGDITRWASTAISEVAFPGNDTSHSSTVLYLNGTNAEEDGGVSLYLADANCLSSAKLVASLPAPYSGLKATFSPSGDIHFLVYAQAWPNGTAYNPDLSEKPRSTGRIYEGIYARHWDTWITPRKNAVFGGVLKQSVSNTPAQNATISPNSTQACTRQAPLPLYALSGELKNFVVGVKNVTVLESPYDQGGSTDYDLSRDGSKVAFMAKDIDLPMANYTSTQIWLVPFSGTSKDAVRLNARGSAALAKYPETVGASSYPSFSWDGKYLAWGQMNGINYESDRNILYVVQVDGDKPGEIKRTAGKWDRTIDAPVWSKDSKTIFVAAPDKGTSRLFAVPVGSGDDYQPKNITDAGSVVAYYSMPDGRVLVSSSAYWTSRDFYSVAGGGNTTAPNPSPLPSTTPRIYLQANLRDPELAGLSPDILDEFYYSSNTSEIKQHSWIIKPANFSAEKKYPLAFLVHGGPQPPWQNSWSTRWNLKTWADQGYVVIAPNPTASLGWGQNLTDAIGGRWGSYPYWDLVHAWEYADKNLKYVDTSRGIAAGASFGGYMVNWIQGHELGRKFKALVCHDGSTSTLSQYQSEELWFMDKEFLHPMGPADFKEGSPYYDWNPLLYMDNWATPQLVIHSEKDYRLAVTDGIELFNLLQVRGVPSKFLTFPDENHWVLNRENSRVWHREVMGWINYYSGISDKSPFTGNLATEG